MILYKYRSLANLEHILDIILNQRLHCSTYSELNDPFEGIFETTFPHYPLIGLRNRGVLFRRAWLRRQQDKTRQSKTIYKKVEDLLGGKEIKIYSLSSDSKDVRLWSYYADGHKGIVIGIDFSGLEERNGSRIIHPVTYHEKLPWGLIIPLLGVEEPKPIKPHEVLTRKTKHWVFESEYRIIEESKYLEEGKYFDIKGRIKTIYLGTRTSDVRRKLLDKIVPREILIYTTKINEKKIIVERDKLIEGREETATSNNAR